MDKRKKSKGNIEFQDSNFYFDDCPICCALKKAEEEGKNLTITELKQSFKEATAKAAVVEGPLIEDAENEVN